MSYVFFFSFHSAFLSLVVARKKASTFFFFLLVDLWAVTIGFIQQINSNSDNLNWSLTIVRWCAKYFIYIILFIKSLLLDRSQECKVKYNPAIVVKQERRRREETSIETDNVNTAPQSAAVVWWVRGHSSCEEEAGKAEVPGKEDAIPDETNSRSHPQRVRKSVWSWEDGRSRNYIEFNVIKLKIMRIVER